MLRACLLLCLVAVSRQVSITQLEVPSAVEVGKDAELQCKYDEEPLYVKWWWTPLYVPGVPSLIYQRVKGGDAEVLKKNIESKEGDTIILRDVEVNNSGVYECEAFGIKEARKHEQMIVYTNGTEFTLNATKVDDGPDEDSEQDVQLQCVVRDVSPEPELLITIGEGEPLKEIDVELTSSDGLYDLTAWANVSASAIEGQEVRCEMLYKNENVKHQQYLVSMLLSTAASDDPTTTEAPEETTESQLASELQGPNGACSHGCSWALYAVAVLQLYFLF